MPPNVATRSSTRRPKRNIKSTRCSDICCETTQVKKKTPIKNHRKPTKTKKNGKSVSHNVPARETQMQPVKSPIVVLISLSPEVIGEKTKTTTEGTTRQTRDSKRSRNATKVKQADKSHKSPNDKVIDETKLPTLRTRRNCYETKGRTNEKLLSNNRSRNKHEEKPGSPSTVDDNGKVLTVVLEKVPGREKTANKQEGVFKRPINGVRKSVNDVATPSPPLKLRGRTVINYAESSLDSSVESQEKQNTTHKIPVYRQAIVENENKKKRQRTDLYEFDEVDSDNAAKRKKRKGANSSSEEYDRTVQNILKNVVNKVRKRNKKVIFADKRNNNVKLKQMKKNIIENKHDTNEKREQIDHVKNIIKEKKIENSLQQNQVSEIPLNIHQKNAVEMPNNGDELKECFGFENDKSTSNVHNSKIAIISNIQLQPGKELNLSIQSPARFRESRPKANSTMLNVFSPWRFNEINIKRNPHFLAIKESSLPCMSQEMVLDHSVVERFEDLSRSFAAKTPQRNTVGSPSKKKTPVQKHLTDYFDSKSGIKNKENLNISLFDVDQLSPIKNYSFNNKVNLAKRKILCEKDENVSVQSSTPRRNVPSPAPQPDPKDTYFGFTSDDEEGEEDKVALKKKKEDKPFRVSVNVNDKKYTRQKVKKPEKTPPNEHLSLSDDESYENSDESETESHNGQIGLFDDLDYTSDNLRRPKQLKKKTKIKWLDNDNPKPKKRKDEMTEEEKEAAEKWAEAFNSMCEEVEEFPLEIE